MTSITAYRKLVFMQNNLALALVAISIIIVERIVKFYITENIRIGESIPVIGNLLMITRTENIGAGFGILSGQNWLFIGAAILVFVLVIYFYPIIIYNKNLVFASAFIIGGTVGNMMDRLFFGHVIDFIDLSFWPTFNISDLALTIGTILLFIYMKNWQKPVDKELKYVPY